VPCYRHLGDENTDEGIEAARLAGMDVRGVRHTETI